MKDIVFTLSCILFMGCHAGDTKQSQQTIVKDNTTGKELFMNNCYQCHRADSELMGPSLTEVKKRWPDEKLLYEFIRNPMKVISNNSYAGNLYKKYNQTIMPPYPSLTDLEIEAILQYADTLYGR